MNWARGLIEGLLSPWFVPRRVFRASEQRRRKLESLREGWAHVVMQRIKPQTRSLEVSMELLYELHGEDISAARREMLDRAYGPLEDD